MLQAAARLETAVERLAAALSARLARSPGPAALGEGEMVPRAEVAAIATRLDATIARLRAVMQEEMRPGGSGAEDRGEDDRDGEE